MREFDSQCKAAEGEQVSVRAQEAETEQVSVCAQEVETDCPKLSSGLNNLPTWMDCDSGRKSLVRKSRRSIAQAHLFCLKAQQVSTKYYDAHYKDAHNAAILELKIKRARGEPASEQSSVTSTR